MEQTIIAAMSPPPNSNTIDQVESIFMWIILVVDSLVFLMAVAWLVYLLRRKKGWNIKKLVSCMSNKQATGINTISEYNHLMYVG
jgi:hypothetical protein